MPRASQRDSSPPARRRRATQGTQSQSQSQSGKKKRRARDEDEDDDEEEEDEEEGSGRKGEASQEDLMRKANDLVRLALFTENHRGSLRRDEINKKVMGNHTRSFNVIFEMAQNILVKTFGMELAELMSRAERDKAGAPSEDTGANAVTGLKKKVTSTSKTYILRSVLDSALIEASVEEDAGIQQAAVADSPDDQKVDSTLIGWRAGDDLTSLSILHVVLSLILIGGRSLPEPQLYAQLKKLHLKSTTVLPSLNQFTGTHRVHTLDALLAQFTKQGYLDKQKVSTMGGAGASQRGRKRAADGDGDGEDGVQYEWKWGSRAMAEIGEMGIAEFVKGFMGARFAEHGEEEEEPTQATQAGADVDPREKYEKSVMKDIVRSAGGPLIDIKSKHVRPG